jgi:hypothetical protein
MTTVINTPSGSSSEGSGSGVIVGVLIVVLLAVLLLIFGLPYLRNRGTATPGTGSATINVQLPEGIGTGGTGGTDNTGGTGGATQ